MITELKRIVLAEDNQNDVELTLAALAEINLANEVVVLRDGAETLDYLYRRHGYADRPPGNPAVLLLDLKMPKVDGLDVLRALKADDDPQNDPRRDADVFPRRAGSHSQLQAGRERVCRQAGGFPRIHRCGATARSLLGRRQRTATWGCDAPLLAMKKTLFVHDMKNMLGIIIGYSNLLLDEIPPGDSKRLDVAEIRKAGEKALELLHEWEPGPLEEES